MSPWGKVLSMLSSFWVGWGKQLPGWKRGSSPGGSQLAALSGNQHWPPGRSSVLLLQTTHFTVHLQGKGGHDTNLHFSQWNLNTEKKYYVLSCSFYRREQRLAGTKRHFFFFFLFSFGFHCYLSSVERRRHAGSSCICFHYYQGENFHFPTELKVQGPAQFPSIISESFLHDHLLSWWAWEGNQEGQSIFSKQNLKALSWNSHKFGSKFIARLIYKHAWL